MIYNSRKNGLPLSIIRRQSGLVRVSGGSFLTKRQEKQNLQESLETNGYIHFAKNQFRIDTKHTRCHKNSLDKYCKTSYNFNIKRR